MIQKWSLQPFFIHDLVHPNKKIADKSLSFFLIKNSAIHQQIEGLF